MTIVRKTPAVAIVIINYFGIQDTLVCIESVMKSTYQGFQIFLIDNGSSQDQVEELSNLSRQNSKITFLPQDTNLGFAEGNNVAMREILKLEKFKYIYFLNNDTVIDSNFLTPGITFLETNPTFGIVASTLIQFYNHNKLDNAGHELLNCLDMVPRGRNTSPNKYNIQSEVLGVCSAGALYRASTLRDIGDYDKEFFLNYEDADLSLRAILYGHKCMYIPQSIVFHKVNASVNKARSYEYSLRSQFNMLKTALYNIPTPVLIFDLPFFVLRDIITIFVTLITGRWGITSVFIKARILCLQNLSDILATRKKNMKHKNISSWYYISHQKFFLTYYIKYTWDIYFKGRLSELESHQAISKKIV